ncbi:Blue-light-activated protein [Pseudoruegeria aquimaris]|uniref:histidine kinase n=1 Tax=Pseudoruegeria aquimaris TaxID=393663 RepID=A0A1Y5R6K2_9RHOB|nr:ATP-binding protein [Pseudoruegeria aquimaris]SLN10428.1 Blue-light-activated protein [Pseudoruegeria aquimaris]
MSDTAVSPQSMAAQADPKLPAGSKSAVGKGAAKPATSVQAARRSVLIVLSVLLLIAAWRTQLDALRVPLVATGLSVLAAIAVSWLSGKRAQAQQKGQLSVVAAFIEHDSAPSFVTDADGIVRHGNAAAQAMYPLALGKPLSSIFRAVFARPEKVMNALHGKAREKGAAREDVVTRRGHMRLMVHRLGEEGFLWRFEDVYAAHAPGKGTDGLSLPMLIASEKGAVLFMNDAMKRLLGRKVRGLSDIFGPGILRPEGPCSVQTGDGAVRVDVARVVGAGGRQELYFLPPRESAAEGTRNIDVDSLPVAALLLAEDGRVSFMNQRARVLLPGGLRVRPAIEDLLLGVSRPLADWLGAARKGNGPHKAELLQIRNAGGERFVHATLADGPADAEGQRLIVLSDATELKTLEAQFVQSQKMQTIGQLAGGVAHDFNNLLTAISGHCDLLLLKHGKDDPDYADLEQIAQNANRAASLVGQLLAFSRKQTMRLERVDLRECLSDLTHLLNRLVGEKVRLSFNHDPDVGPVKADPRQIEQVMMNLVVNARDAMPDGGTVSIETTSRTIRAPLQKGRAEIPPGNYSIIRVIDSGAGIPQDNLDKVFEPFFTSKAPGEGTGLGLSTVYGIIKQSNGFVFAESAPGQGACFSIYLPAMDVEEEMAAVEEPSKAQEPVASSPVEQGVVLLVEDEEPVRAFASRALRLRADVGERWPRIRQVAFEKGAEGNTLRAVGRAAQERAPAVAIPAARPVQRLADHRDGFHRAAEFLQHRLEEPVIAVEGRMFEQRRIAHHHVGLRAECGLQGGRARLGHGEDHEAFLVKYQHGMAPAFRFWRCFQSLNHSLTDRAV